MPSLVPVPPTVTVQVSKPVVMLGLDTVAVNYNAVPEVLKVLPVDGWKIVLDSVLA